MIDGLIFDFDATLGKGSLDKAAFHADIFRLCGCPRTYRSESEFGVALRARLAELDKERMETEREFTFHNYYQLALATLGITASDALLDELYASLLGRYSFRFYDGSLNALQKLHERGFALTVLSNTVNGTTRHVLESTGVSQLFRGILQSCDIGIRKPSRLAFQLALDRLELPPGAALSIGNSPYFDLNPAARLGIGTVLVESELSYREPTGSALEREPDFRVQSIAELPAILHRPNNEFPNPQNGS